MKPLKFILPATLLFSLATFAQDERPAPPPPPKPPVIASIPTPPPPPPLKITKHKSDLQKAEKVKQPQKPVKPKPPVAPQPLIKEE